MLGLITQLINVAMFSINDLKNPRKTEQSEAAILEKLKSGRLLNWIYSLSGIAADPDDFMNTICDFLAKMQEAGKICGYSERVERGKRSPLVGGITLPKDPDLSGRYVPPWMTFIYVNRVHGAKEELLSS